MFRLVGSGMLELVGRGETGEAARGESFLAEAITRAATVVFVLLLLAEALPEASASQAFRIWLMDFFRFFGYF